MFFYRQYADFIIISYGLRLDILLLALMNVPRVSGSNGRCMVENRTSGERKNHNNAACVRAINILYVFFNTILFPTRTENFLT